MPRGQDVHVRAVTVGSFRYCPHVELHPQLRRYVVSTSVGQMIQHPLVHQLFFGTGMEIGWVNEAYEEKTRAVNAALEAGEWDMVVALH